MLKESARMAYLADAKPDILALLLTDAVAPVKMRVGGYFAEESPAVLRRSGSAAWEKMKAPLLQMSQPLTRLQNERSTYQLTL